MINLINYSQKLTKALSYGRAAHDSIKQVRKYTGEPYWTHTEEVSATVQKVDHTEDMLIAALLHDVLEDVFPENPYFNRHEIKNLFGENVLKMVEELTDEYTKERYPQFNRRKRKELERNRLQKISAEAKTIKLADLISNSANIVERDAEFAAVYLQEKSDLLSNLEGGSPVLMSIAQTQLIEETGKLEQLS